MTTGSLHRLTVILPAILLVLQFAPRADEAGAASTHSAQWRTAPLVFFRTANAETTQLLRRVLRVDPRTGQSIPSVTPPADFRSFVDAAQVGDTSFLAWTTKRGDLWLGAAGPTPGLARRWRVGRAGGFEVVPAPTDRSLGTGSGFLRVSADGRTALLVNGQGRRRVGRYVDLRTGAVRSRRLPVGVSRDVADATVLGDRFVLVGPTGAVVTVGRHGEVVSRGQVPLASTGTSRIGFVNIVGLPGDRAALSFIGGWMYRPGTRRYIARYDARTGKVKITRSYADFDGFEFAATATRFLVFGDDHWTTGRIDGGPLRKMRPPGPGRRPPGSAGIEPDAQGNPYVRGSTTARGVAFVLRGIDYVNRNDMNAYGAFEVLEVDVENARVIRRTRFGDDRGGRSPLPYAFDMRIS